MSNVAVFGGKTASLGEMLQAGMPVPNGFGISTRAQQDFQGKPFSSGFMVELKQAFQELGVEYVAVRSSAIAEDSSDASWAGQLESYLNVTIDGLEKAVRDCWDSIKTSHAVAYAKDKGVKDEDLLVGVAVQAMVPSEVAGVMFTVDPVTGQKDRLVIEGLYGLGEMLVQGVVTPDRYVVTKRPLGVEEFDIEIKSKQMIYKDGKNIIEELPIEVGDKAVLRENQVLELAEIGQKVEKHYGKAMDIEWARTNNRFYIVQARPVTTI